MKRFFSIALLFVLIISSTSLGLQYVYQTYLCEDQEEYLEIAGRKIIVCGKTCSLEESKAQNSPVQVNYNTEIPPVFIGRSASLDLNVLKGDHAKHKTDYLTNYQFELNTRLIKPPSVHAYLS
ncbi:MAG: hypothetical protein JXR03_19285 [Cyclobacteriaceae bacterium]